MEINSKQTSFRSYSIYIQNEKSETSTREIYYMPETLELTATVNGFIFCVHKIF